ncbi:hypothetical protein [Haloarchaeobius sp. DFWS5]
MNEREVSHSTALLFAVGFYTFVSGMYGVANPQVVAGTINVQTGRLNEK